MEQGLSLLGALLAHSYGAHEVQRPVLIGLLRQDAPQLLLGIIQAVLANELGNIHARGRLRHEVWGR